MGLDRDHIKEVFSSKLSNFEPDLPDLAWERIDADLARKSVLEKMPIRKKVYSVVTTVAAVAAMVFAIMYLLPQQEDEIVNPAIAQSLEQISGGDSLSVGNKNVESNGLLAANVNPEQLQVKKDTKNQRMQDLGVSQSIDDEVSYIDKIFDGDKIGESLTTDTVATLVALVDEEIETKILNIEDRAFEENLSKQIAAFESKGKELDNLLSSTDVPNKDKSFTTRGIQLGLEGGSGFSKSNDAKNQLKAIHQGLNGVVLRSSRVKLKHNQPITFGVGVAKQLTNKISVETGLNYAYISSKIKSDDDHIVKQKDVQYFHYLGLPLSVNYTFSEWKRFRFYTTLGVMFQKDIYGRLRSNIYAEEIYNFDKTNEVKISQKHLQFSTSATLGASYPLYDKLRVYTNIGGAYYFDAKNKYETIYSDKKWLFNLNLGIKFDF